MKTMKRTMLLVLVLVTIVSILSIPVSAATNWQSKMSTFKPVSEYYASLYPKYLWALQRFLFAHPETQAEMAGSTHDGLWGSKTRAALIDFQRYKGLSQDAIAGANTWNAIAAELYCSSSQDFYGKDGDFLSVRRNDWPVFVAVDDGSDRFCYYYGTGASASCYIDTKFHPHS